MSSRKSRSRQTGASMITDEQINDLVLQLHRLLPELANNRRSGKVQRSNQFFIMIPFKKFNFLFQTLNLF